MYLSSAEWKLCGGSSCSDLLSDALERLHDGVLMPIYLDTYVRPEKDHKLILNKSLSSMRSSLVEDAL